MIKNETMVERFVRVFDCDKPEENSSFNYGLILNKQRTVGLQVEEDERWKLYNLGRLEIKSPKPKGNYRVWDSSFNRVMVNKALTVLKRRAYVDVSVAIGNHDKLSNTYFVLILSLGKNNIFLAPTIYDSGEVSSEEELFKDFPRDFAKLVLKVV
jgi:hypothetical protein